MLNADTVKQINKQIAKELETVDSFISDDDEKDAALKRIIQLKQVLDPNPSSEQVMDAFVQALAQQMVTRKPDEPKVAELVAGWFRR
jgi:hypothetical protein